MKRILLFVMPLMCLLLLSACIGAFHITGEGDAKPTAAATQDMTSATHSPSVQPEVTGSALDGQEITLSFDFGERTGVYSGEMMDGLPHGYGTFSSRNAQGVGWVYEGEWNVGHMQGEGMTTFETGYKETGWYENDYLSGQGSLYQQDQLLFEGEFLSNIPNGQGTLYSYCGEAIYTGEFTEGFIDETEEARQIRVRQFKQDCETPEFDALYESAQNIGSLRAQVSGTVYNVYEMDEAGYDSSFIMELSGGNIVCVAYHLSVGERPVAAGKEVTVWGIADYLYTYETEAGTQAAIPMIEAWDVMDISGTQL